MDEERTRGVPEAVSEYADRTATHLARVYPTGERDDTDWSEWGDEINSASDFYKRERELELAHRDINWWVERSERLVVCLGRTFDGDFIYDDRCGVVLKFQPWVRARDCEGSANAHAVDVWQTAIERGDTDLFADVLAYADDRAWLAMEYCIPINTGAGVSNPPFDHLHDPLQEHVDTIQQRFHERGWDGNFTGGNIGLTDDGDIVLIDIGGHTDAPV